MSIMALNVIFYGEYLEYNGMTSQKTGQFLTPMSICKVRAEITYNDKENKYPVTVSDCCSGSGSYDDSSCIDNA